MADYTLASSSPCSSGPRRGGPVTPRTPWRDWSFQPLSQPELTLGTAMSESHYAFNALMIVQGHMSAFCTAALANASRSHLSRAWDDDRAEFPTGLPRWSTLSAAGRTTPLQTTTSGRVATSATTPASSAPSQPPSTLQSARPHSSLQGPALFRVPTSHPGPPQPAPGKSRPPKRQRPLSSRGTWAPPTSTWTRFRRSAPWSAAPSPRWSSSRTPTAPRWNGPAL